MSNEEYQSLFAHRGAELRARFLAGADDAGARLVADVPDDDLAPLVQNLGGHDIGVLLDAYRACDEVTDRPSVVFAYTVKGWGLPIAGDPLNHSALLSGRPDRRAAPVRRPGPGDASGTASTRVAGGPDLRGDGRRAEQRARPAAADVADPRRRRRARPPRRRRTQEAFGRILTRLGDIAGVAERIVTTSPDVSVSTNLGGWINKSRRVRTRPRPPTSSARTDCCAGGRHRRGATSSWASAR